MRLLTHTFIITVLFLILTGCGLKNKDENSHPLFKRAVKAQNSNELGLAIAYFNRYLSLNPESSKTHLRLASIYDENLGQPLRAVYHYERFIEYSPNSPEADSVKKWKEAALRKYYFKARQKFNDPEDVNVLQNTLFLTEQELKKNKFELKKIRALQKKLIKYARQVRDNEKILKAKLNSLQSAHQHTLDEMKKIREELKEKAAVKEVKKEDKKESKKESKKEKSEEDKTTEKVEKKAEKPVEKKAEKKEEKKDEKAETKKVEKKVVKPEIKKVSKKEVKKEKETKPLAIIPKAIPDAPPFVIKTTDKPKDKKEKAEIKVDKPEVEIDLDYQTYTVQKGDSLSGISRKFYGSSKYYKRIFEANRNIIPSEKALRPGQVLKIPRL